MAAPIATTFPGLAEVLRPQQPAGIPLGLQSLLLFGEAGTGKTSVAAKFPNHMYLDLEGSASNHTINRLNIPRSWPKIKEFVQWVVDGGDLGDNQTLIIDTAPDMWDICRAWWLRSKGLTEEPANDYGKLLRAMRDDFTGVFNQLMMLQQMKRMGVVLIAHENAKEVKTPTATNVVAFPRVSDKEIGALLAAKPQMVFRTVVTQTHPVTGEHWPKAKYLMQSKAEIEGAVVKDRTDRLPAFMATSYEVLAREYSKTPKHKNGDTKNGK